MYAEIFSRDPSKDELEEGAAKILAGEDLGSIEQDLKDRYVKNEMSVSQEVHLGRIAEISKMYDDNNWINFESALRIIQ